MDTTHSPATCTICTEVPHLARYGLPMWAVCDQIGKTITAVAKHARTYPSFHASLPAAVGEELRRAESSARHHRSTRPREEAA